MTDKLLLTPEEQDNCTPTKEQLENYLAQPDDRLAASLDPVAKRLVAKTILYGENIAQAQLAKVHENRLDRPELRKKIKAEYVRFNHRLIPITARANAIGEFAEIGVAEEEFYSRILALIAGEVERKERERIVKELLKYQTPVIKDLGLIQITMCIEDWQALKRGEK